MLLGGLGGLLSGLTGVLGNAAFVLSVPLFLCIESASAGARLALVAGVRRATDDALRPFARGTRRFIGVTTVIGLVTGVIDTVVLALLGIRCSPSR